MSASGRAEWLDSSRALAMFFIIWLHADAAPDGIGQVVGGAISLFFLLAGYFSSSQSRVVVVRAGRLALAWAAWSLLSMGLIAVADSSFEWDWRRAVGWGVAAYNTPLWFLKTLVVYQLVLAALLALRVLPRCGWLLVLVLLACSYTTEPAQYAAVRFDYFWLFLLGNCLRVIPLGVVQGYLLRHSLALGLAALVVLVQPWGLAAWAAWAELGWRHCNLPVAALAWMLLMVLAGVLLGKYLPGLNGRLARAGRWMLFIYASHSFVLAPLYAWSNPRCLWNVWAPVLVLPLLTLLGSRLCRTFPRAMSVFMARSQT